MKDDVMKVLESTQATVVNECVDTGPAGWSHGIGIDNAKACGRQYDIEMSGRDNKRLEADIPQNAGLKTVIILDGRFKGCAYDTFQQLAVNRHKLLDKAIVYTVVTFGHLGHRNITLKNLFGDS